MPPPRPVSALERTVAPSGAVHVVLTGELDVTTMPDLDDALREAEAESAWVVVDLRQLELMDCAAAELLLATDRRIRRAGGRMTVIRGGAEVDWFLALTGIGRQLDLTPSLRLPPLTRGHLRDQEHTAPRFGPPPPGRPSQAPG